MALYEDRRHAGRVLASALDAYRSRIAENGLVLALPRGGVPVGYEVSRRFGVPLDVCVVRKLGVPQQEELAMGAIASGGIRVLNPGAISAFSISPSVIEEVVANETRELSRRERAYRGDCPPLEVQGKWVVLVDDGLATGASMRAAALGLRQRNPQHILVAVPVASPETCEGLMADANDVVCAATPEPFFAVGPWYSDFSQTTDHEVRQLLGETRQLDPARRRRAPPDSTAQRP